MRTISLIAAALLLLAPPMHPPARAEPSPQIPAADRDWPQFRGVRASGLAVKAPPTEWDAQEGDNILWKTPIPGLGHSSPVIWGGRVFLTTAVSGKEDPELKVGLYGNITPVLDDTEHRFLVIALNKKTGRVLWQREAHQGVPTIRRHPKATHANSTPATDGKHLVAFFGSEGLFCYGMDGNLLWKKDFGRLDSGYFVVPDAQWGFGSSPIIYRDMVIVQCDVQENSFIAALDVKTGKEIWRTPRDEVPTWSTPTVYETATGPQVIINGYKHIGGYDALTGKEIWRMRGGGDIPVPTPVVGGELIFITNAHGGMAPIYAIRSTARGDISLEGGATSNEHVAWSHRTGGNYMQTPIVYRDQLFTCRDNGVMSVFDLATGERLNQFRLGTGAQGFTASPVAAGGKLYFSGEDGDVFVVTAGHDPKVLSTNSMDEPIMATPAISEGRIYIRTKGRLFCIGERPTEPRP